MLGFAPIAMTPLAALSALYGPRPAVVDDTIIGVNYVPATIIGVNHQPSTILGVG